jgi:hypothetical protein
MVLAIEADGMSYRDSRSTRDRDRLRKEHLERLGWTFHRIWSTNWFQDPESEIAKVQEAYREAVAKVPPPAPDGDSPPPEPAAERGHTPSGTQADTPGPEAVDGATPAETPADEQAVADATRPAGLPALPGLASPAGLPGLPGPASPPGQAIALRQAVPPQRLTPGE